MYFWVLLKIEVAYSISNRLQMYMESLFLNKNHHK